jgi:hypothetical protein
MRNKMKDEDEGEDEDDNISIYSSARIMDALIDYK